MRQCLQPGCPAVIERGRYCAAHSRAPIPRPDDRESAARRGYDRRWRSARAAYAASHPTCEVCGAPAVEVHHVVPLSRGGSSDARNLRALCLSCHRLTRRDERVRVGGIGSLRSAYVDPMAQGKARTPENQPPKVGRP